MWENRSFVAICPWTAAKLTCLHRACEGHITSLWKLCGQLWMASHFTHLKNTLLSLTLSQRLPGGVAPNRQLLFGLRESKSCEVDLEKPETRTLLWEKTFTHAKIPLTLQVILLTSGKVSTALLLPLPDQLTSLQI